MQGVILIGSRHAYSFHTLPCVVTGTNTALLILTMAYAVLLLASAPLARGRIVLGGIAIGVISAVAAFGSPMLLLLVAVPTTSALRVLFHHPSLQGLLLDTLLTLIAVGFAFWAAPHGGGALALWSFFLVQSLSYWIQGPRQPKTLDFDAAERCAHQALQNLAKRTGETS